VRRKLVPTPKKTTINRGTTHGYRADQTTRNRNATGDPRRRSSDELLRAYRRTPQTPHERSPGTGYRYGNLICVCQSCAQTPGSKLRRKTDFTGTHRFHYDFLPGIAPAWRYPCQPLHHVPVASVHLAGPYAE